MNEQSSSNWSEVVNNEPKGDSEFSERFRGVVKFLPAFEQPGFQAGEWIASREIQHGVLSAPYTALSDTCDAFVQAAYDSGLVLTGFDAPRWAQSAEAEKLKRDESELARATAGQLARLLIACIRQDRFVEGSLMSDFQSGLILRILQRAAAILADK
jgi:hypothetical protein